MSVRLVGRTAIQAERLRPGESAAFSVLADQVVQVVALEGAQAVSLVAFAGPDLRERLSVSQTRARNNSIMLTLGMNLYSNRGNPLLELVEDSVGRHDLLHPHDLSVVFGGEADPEKALVKRLGEFGIAGDDLPDPVNLFMKVGILQRGELDIQESLVEKGDSVMLRAVVDTVVGVTALPARFGGGDLSKKPEALARLFQ